MKLEERDDFVDLVAQAVIDRIEERDRINGLVDMVVARVIAMQKQAMELEAARDSANADATPVSGMIEEEVNVEDERAGRQSGHDCTCR